MEAEAKLAQAAASMHACMHSGLLHAVNRMVRVAMHAICTSVAA